VPSSRPVIIAGAGIGGLTAALAIAQRGSRVAVFDQAERLEEAGAGIQLSPNASRVLLALGLGERLRHHAVVPEELRVMTA
jgi:salicylate hydroxylase